MPSPSSRWQDWQPLSLASWAPRWAASPPAACRVATVVVAPARRDAERDRAGEHEDGEPADGSWLRVWQRRVLARLCPRRTPRPGSAARPPLAAARRRRRRRPRSTAAPAAGHVARSQAGDRFVERPAGHGSASSNRGPMRTARADIPAPAARCHADTDATGDVSTAAISHTDDARRRAAPSPRAPSAATSPQGRRRTRRRGSGSPRAPWERAGAPPTGASPATARSTSRRGRRRRCRAIVAERSPHRT